MLSLMGGVFLMLSVSLVSTRSEAQTVPDCPWPVGDTRITASVTYTLTEDCKVTDRMRIFGSGTVVTINGGGYSVDASALRASKSIIASWPNTNLIVDNITFIGGGRNHAAALHLGDGATISNTTFRNVYRSAIAASVGVGGTYTLTNILVEDVQGRFFNYADAAMAVSANNNAVFTINNMVVRNALQGNAAIGIIRNGGATVTMTGCFTADGVWPQVFLAASILLESRENAAAASATAGQPSANIRQPQPQPAECP